MIILRIILNSINYVLFDKIDTKFIQRIKKGPHDCFSWCSWCILNFLPLDRSNSIYENYTNMALEKENKDRIIRDIERTFPNRKILKKDLRKKETSLYKVLKAFLPILFSRLVPRSAVRRRDK